MGTGKSQSAITWMNSHKEDKFIYITPYLEEATRIKKGCPSLNFCEPSDKVAKYNYRKSEHTAALIKKGKNITTTHQAFKGYTPEMHYNILHQGYTLIIDENVDILETFDFHPDDLQMAVDAGYIEDNNGIYNVTGKEYNGRNLKDLFRLLKSRELVRIDSDDDTTSSLFYWALPPDLINAFKDVFILTYLFEGQSLYYFLKIHNIPYEYIGIERIDTGTGFQFSEYPGYTPSYVQNLGERLHILDVPKLNSVGDDYYSLSMSWFEKKDEEIEQLKRNVYNCFFNIWEDIPVEERLWATYKKEYGRMKGKGYTKSFLTFNTKASNNYTNKTHLVYIVNLFMNVNDKKFYQKHGVEVDEDLFALSTMVQWIWRSAIRRGSEVYLYIPSSRMRKLLTDWINNVSKGGNTVA